MKTFKAHYGILFFLVLSSSVVTVILAYRFLPEVLIAYKAYWFLTLSALIVILTPVGNIRLASCNAEKPRTKLWLWIFQIFVFELSLMAIFFGVCTLVHKPTLIIDSFSYTTVQLGLFPWTIMVTIACTFGLISYRYQQNAYLATIFYPVLKGQPSNTPEIIINSLVRVATLFAFGSTIATATLLIANTLFPQHIQSLSNINSSNIIFCLILIVIVNSTYVKRGVYLLSVRTRCSIFFRIWTLLFTLTGLIIVLSLLLGSASEEIIVNKIPKSISALLKYGWLANWHLFTMFWWMAWSPVAGIFIAKLSRGYSLRSIILVIGILPTFLGLLTHFHHYFPITIKLPLWLCISIFLAGMFIFFAIITPTHTFDSVMQTYLTKLDIIKYRATDRFLVSVLQLSTIMICLYLCTGIILLTLLFFDFLLFLSIILLFLPIGLILMLVYRGR